MAACSSEVDVAVKPWGHGVAASQPPHSLFPSFPIPFIPFIPSSCDRRHIPLHANLTKLEQARRAKAAPSRAADSREFRVTTKDPRSEEHTSKLQTLMRISYAVFCLKKKN